MWLRAPTLLRGRLMRVYPSVENNFYFFIFIRVTSLVSYYDIVMRRFSKRDGPALRGNLPRTPREISTEHNSIENGNKPLEWSISFENRRVIVIRILSILFCSNKKKKKLLQRAFLHEISIASRRCSLDQLTWKR